MFSCALFIMLMKCYLGLGNIEMFEKDARFARVLTGNDINLSQSSKGTQRNVVQVPNGRSDQVEHVVPSYWLSAFVSLRICCSFSSTSGRLTFSVCVRGKSFSGQTVKLRTC